MWHISDMMRHDDQQSIPRLILDRVIADAAKVWTPADFVDLGPREAVDKALQRMVRSDELRRIERGLYDRPKTNRLTKTQSVPDYRAIIEAVARRDKARFVIDGMTAANMLGLTNAVPAKIEVLVDARLKSIELGNQRIVFKNAAPSRLYWAGRPGMYLVQALHWMQDTMRNEEERSRLDRTIRKLLTDETHGPWLVDDLRAGLSAMPIWMQETLRRPLTVASNGTSE